MPCHVGWLVGLLTEELPLSVDCDVDCVICLGTLFSPMYGNRYPDLSMCDFPNTLGYLLTICKHESFCWRSTEQRSCGEGCVYSDQFYSIKVFSIIVLSSQDFSIDVLSFTVLKLCFLSKFSIKAISRCLVKCEHRQK